MPHGVARSREIFKIAHDRVRPYTSGKGALVSNKQQIAILGFGAAIHKHEATMNTQGKIMRLSENAVSRGTTMFHTWEPVNINTLITFT